MMDIGTGVYYQAMPAVGPDGKNVMKLIPVQKVNGQFVQMQVLGTKNDTQVKGCSQLAHISLAASTQNRLPALQAIGDGRFILKTSPEGHALVKFGESHQQGVNDLIKNPIKQVPIPQVAPKMAHTTVQSSPQNKKVVTVNGPLLPVNVKSPMLPSGHYLQIPCNATVRTLPASALPQSIKKRICNSTNVPSIPVKGLPTVVYVSPVNSLKLGSSQQLPCLTKPSELPQTLSLTANSGKNLDILPTSNSKTTHGVTTPMKWVVQEGTGCTAPCLIPVTSPSMTSDILKAVKQMEAARLKNTAGEHSSTTSQEKVSPGKDNALVMYNGKVYFVAKKDSEITKDVITKAGSGLHATKSGQPSTMTEGSHTNMSQQKVSKPANEIIDLCDDDEESSTCTGSDILSERSEKEIQNDDDSNVIFVSYIPPKSESESSHKPTETALQTQQNNCEKGVNSPGIDTVNMGEDFRKCSTSVSGTNLNLRCQDNAPVLENVESSCVSDQPQNVCDHAINVTEKDSPLLCRLDTEAVTEVSLEKPVLDQICQQKSDSEFRKLFGITSDLRICLKRTNLNEEPDREAERKSHNKRTLEGIRRIIRQSQIETKLTHLIQTQVSTPKSEDECGPKNSKRQKLEQDGWTSSDTTTVTITSSLPHPSSPVNSEEQLQLVPTVPLADSESLQTCPRKNLSCNVACEDAHQPTVSPCPSSSSLQPAQTSLVLRSVGGGVGPSGSRKTPPRVSKGSGRVCSACPCGTKVGAVSASPLSKPEERPVLPDLLNSSRGEAVVGESNRDCRKGAEAVENSISNPPHRSGVSDTAGDEAVRDGLGLGSATHSDGTCSVYNASSLLEGSGDLDSSSKETACSSSSSGGVVLDETFEQSPRGELQSGPQEPKTLTKTERKVPSSSVAQVNNGGDCFPYELYPSLVLDPEEIKRQERIRRLKDILRDKEAALKKLRQNM